MKGPSPHSASWLVRCLASVVPVNASPIVLCVAANMFPAILGVPVNVRPVFFGVPVNVDGLPVMVSRCRQRGYHGKKQDENTDSFFHIFSPS